MFAGDEFYVRFWGVRGSIACPGPKTLRYGGNTSCLEVKCGDYFLIFDAGTGMKGLGEHFMEMGAWNADIFLTHTHVDHINGFPFFKPSYLAGKRIKIHAGHLLPSGESIQHVFEQMMAQPFFPIAIKAMAATNIFIDFRAGETLDISSRIRLRTALLNHPNGATGYRIEFGGKSICYVTDTEHPPGAPDRNVLKLIEGADLFIYDCTYTDEEFPNYTGWGHSTWQEGVRLADAAKVKTLVVFHHDPSHDDDFMDGIAVQLEKVRPGGGVVAKEGMILRP